MRPYNPSKLVWAPPLSLAATHGISGGSLLFLISFPMLLRWFTSHGVALPAYFIQLSQYRNRFLWVTPFGHPRITGYCSFPRLFAACHDLLRLVAPRHPPWTYIRLTILSFPCDVIPFQFRSSNQLTPHTLFLHQL